MSDAIVLPPGCREPAPDRHVLALEEVRLHGAERALILGTAGLVAAFLAWASVTRLPEVAVAPGEVTTAVAAAPLQHLEGGIVEAVLVGEGEVVAEGQPILRLNDAAARADLGQIRTRAASLRLQAERLAALVEGHALAGGAGLLGPQRAALEARVRAQADRRATAEQGVAVRRGEIAMLTGQASALDRQIAIFRDELATRQGLARQGLTTRIAVLEAQRMLLGAAADHERLTAQAATAGRSLAEAEARLVELSSGPVDEARAEAARVAGELAEAEETIVRLQDRMDRTVLRAPAAGMVRGLSVHRPGSVVQPGAPVAELLPRDAPLVVDARVAPRDIGFVAVGQPARVKVQAFDFARFGTVDGVVERISAGAFLDEARQPYHRVRVSLTRDHVGDVPGRAVVAAGMAVQAEVTTGRKSILQYLLKPIYASMATAFRER